MDTVSELLYGASFWHGRDGSDCGERSDTDCPHLRNRFRQKTQSREKSIVSVKKRILHLVDFYVGFLGSFQEL